MLSSTRIIIAAIVTLLLVTATFVDSYAFIKHKNIPFIPPPMPVLLPPVLPPMPQLPQIQMATIPTGVTPPPMPMLPQIQMANIPMGVTPPPMPMLPQIQMANIPMGVTPPPQPQIPRIEMANIPMGVTPPPQPQIPRIEMANIPMDFAPPPMPPDIAPPPEPPRIVVMQPQRKIIKIRLKKRPLILAEQKINKLLFIYPYWYGFGNSAQQDTDLDDYPYPQTHPRLIWAAADYGNVPAAAIIIDYDSYGRPIYHCRTTMMGKTVYGKAIGRYCFVKAQDREVSRTRFDVRVGD